MADNKLIRSVEFEKILNALKGYIDKADGLKASDFTLGTGLTWDNTGDKHELNIDIDSSVFAVVNALPDSGPTTGNKNKIHIVTNSQEDGDNLFTEYIWVNNKWEKLGEFKADVDLEDYVTTEDLTDELSKYVTSEYLEDNYLTSSEISKTYLDRETYNSHDEANTAKHAEFEESIKKSIVSVSSNNGTISYTTYAGGTGNIVGLASDTSYGLVTSGGDVTIEDGIITVSKIGDINTDDIVTSTELTEQLENYVSTYITSQSYVTASTYASSTTYGLVKLAETTSNPEFSNRWYGVEVDNTSGALRVYVPWTDTKFELGDDQLEDIYESIGAATNDTLGLVYIGEGISVSSEGQISVNTDVIASKSYVRAEIDKLDFLTSSDVANGINNISAKDNVISYTVFGSEDVKTITIDNVTYSTYTTYLTNGSVSYSADDFIKWTDCLTDTEVSGIFEQVFGEGYYK